jgi:hypothetical protein
MSSSFNVTVSPKTPEHPFYNQGSNLGYVINGTQGSTLNLKPNQQYIFNVNTPGHPFYFTTSEFGGATFPGRIPNTPSTEQGTIILDTTNLPPEFYYQCGIHPYMGGKIVLTNSLQQTSSSVIWILIVVVIVIILLYFLL